MAAKDKAIAIIPDFNNSALTFGPTLSTILKLNPGPIVFFKFSLISLIKFELLFSFFSNLIKNHYFFQILLRLHLLSSY